MLRPTDNLRSDHAVVALGMAALSGLARRVREGAEFPVADCTTLLRFMREFVLGVHMRKERELVYPGFAMRANEAALLVGELMRLQEELSELAQALVVLWEPIGELTSDERTGFADTVQAIESRLARLKQLEEGQLFCACDRIVPADDQLDWLRQFERLERDRGSAAVWRERMLELAQRWRA
jgi:hemerythrin-like domain-containing protein